MEKVVQHTRADGNLEPDSEDGKYQTVGGRELRLVANLVPIRTTLRRHCLIRLFSDLYVSGLVQTPRFLPNKIAVFPWMLQVLRPEPESPEGSTSELEAESNPKRKFQTLLQVENLWRIP